jgi:mRNA interferase HicA
MKRSEFIRYLKMHNCSMLREGTKHSIFYNLANNKQATVGRHSELSNLLCKKICRQLGIPETESE